MDNDGSKDGPEESHAGVVKLWDATAGGEVGRLLGHTQHVLGVAFSPDGRRLATASEDQSVRLWDARTGQEIMSLGGHAGAANQVAFSADGNRLAAASSNGPARVWEAPAP
jgi:WD40 repeat protein